MLIYHVRACVGPLLFLTLLKMNNVNVLLVSNKNMILNFIYYVPKKTQTLNREYDWTWIFQLSWLNETQLLVKYIPKTELTI